MNNSYYNIHVYTLTYLRGIIYLSNNLFIYGIFYYEMNEKILFSELISIGFEAKYKIKASPENFLEGYLENTTDDVSYETVRRWLRGSNMPNFKRIFRIAIWLELDLNLFVVQLLEAGTFL